MKGKCKANSAKNTKGQSKLDYNQNQTSAHIIRFT